MKRVRCPKCENFLTFDETKYTEGQSLVFICDHCKKQFSIRLGKSKVQALRKEEKLDEKEFQNAFGSITVIENVFGLKQVLPLQEGDNVIGRRCIGTEINVPIETSDMSMESRLSVIPGTRISQLCRITVACQRPEEITFSLTKLIHQIKHIPHLIPATAGGNIPPMRERNEHF